VAERTGTFYGQAMTAGDIYTVAGGGRGLGNGGPATDASVPEPSGVTVDGSGNLAVAIPGKFYRVRVVAARTGTFYGQAMTAGHIYTVAGNGPGLFSGAGGPASDAQFQPAAITSDAAGDLLIAAANDQRVLMTAARRGTFYGRAMSKGHVYTVAGDGICKFTGDGGPATKAGLCEPEGAAVDAAGNLLIADTSDQRIRVVAATSGSFYGQAMTTGDIYTIAGDGSFGYSGDGGPATGAELNAPTGVAVDAAGNVLIADGNNQRIRVVAATTGTFYGQAMTAGDIYTIAGNGSGGFSGDGGPATSAELNDPAGVATDAAGNVLIADSHNRRIRVVAATTGTFYGQAMTAGDIYTIAGDGKQRFSGDGGPATSAGLNLPSGVTVAAGNVIMADTGHNRIRVVAETSGTFYGVPMTAGNIYTVAGNGRGSAIGGFSGDGGPATKAELGAPGGAAVNGAGDLLIPDFFNDRIRMITG
jgi:trimeric autotransporter adhesin